MKTWRVAPAPGHHGPVRVMSWNVWWRFDSRDQVTVGPAPAAGDRWRDRERAIVETLGVIAPDVVGLQEVWATAGTTQADVLAGAVGMHAAFAAPSLPPPPRPARNPDHAGVEVGVAVLSRWPIVDTSQHALPSGHRSAVALAAVIDHPRGPLHVVTSCIDWEADRAGQRRAQTAAIAALLTDPSRDGRLPVLFTADLNAPPDTAEVRTLTDVAVDAWAGAGGVADRGAAGAMGGGTVGAGGSADRGAGGAVGDAERMAAAVEAGHTLSSGNPLAPREAWQLDHRIDYVMARPGRPEHPVAVDRVFLAGAPLAGVWPSDHYAVVADLQT